MVVIGPGPVVFIVDDDPSVQRALRRLLAAAGYTVETCGSATEFLARPGAPVPACLVLDVRMPGMTGLELQRQLAQTQPELPIIMITGHSSADVRHDALAAGAVAVLDKPFPDQSLLDAIGRALERSG